MEPYYRSEEARIKYAEFLESKALVNQPIGMTVQESDINPMLYDFQRAIVRWACRKGRAAVFADCGLGKTLIQLEWARLMGRTVLIVAPLCVAKQTILEAKKIDLDVRFVRSQEEMGSGISITNYEMIDRFTGNLDAVVLDESSILKSLSGKTRKKLIEIFASIPYRLCCTATPCPNDIAELGNHAEFLGIMSHVEMLASFFVNKADKGMGWVMKGYAHDAFYKWLASWAVCLNNPEDLGFDGSAFVLPRLTINHVSIKSDYKREGELFFTELKGIQDRSAIRKKTINDKVYRICKLIQESGNGSGIETRVQQGVLSGTSRNVEQEDSREKSEIQPESKDKVCGRCRVSRKDEIHCEGIQKEKSSREEVERPTEHVWSNDGTIQLTPKKTRRVLCNLRDKGDSGDFPICGSRPWNGKSEGHSLCSVQLWNRPIQGQCDSSPEGNRLPQWIIWAGLNDEQNRLESSLLDAGISVVSVHGSHSIEEKELKLESWLSGQAQVLLSKPRVCGFGMNFQNACNMAFIGLSDSYESYYQCIRRSWRFGQKQPVNAYIVLTDIEDGIYRNVHRKEEEAGKMSRELVKNVEEFERVEIQGVQVQEAHEIKKYAGKKWELLVGDCVECTDQMPDDSIDLSVYSPPFISLYTYSATERDMGNSKTEKDFFDHYRYLIRNLLRITKQGRNTAVHVSQVPAMLVRDGYIGMKDFRGEVVRQYVAEGWIYHGEVVIGKNPQAQAVRTKSKSLMFVQLKRDSSWLRPGLADYILLFRKPGDNKIPVKPDDITNEDWIKWAYPIWYDIRENNTLNKCEARSDQDEKHICPLQLDVIDRCVRLWSNKGETVFSPFAGIGSEGYQSILRGRRFIGCELKPEYAHVAMKNLNKAENETGEMTLFGGQL